jgi:hypothetical protein
MKVKNHYAHQKDNVESFVKISLTLSKKNQKSPF